MKESLLELLPPFLMQLKETKEKAGRDDAVANQLFQKIEEEISLIKVIFSRLEAWESNVHGRFGDMAKELDKIYYGNNTEADIQSKLNEVSSQFSSLKAYITPPFVLPDPPNGFPWESQGSRNPAIFADNVIEDADIAVDTKKIADMPALWEDVVPHAFLFTLVNLPEKAVIKKSLLIHWWMADACVDQAESRKEAEAYFEKLITLKVMIPVRRDHSSVTHSFILHPRVREELNALDDFRKYPRDKLNEDSDMFMRSLWLSKSSGVSISYRSPRQSTMEQNCFNLDQIYLNFRDIYADTKRWHTMRWATILHFGRLQGSNKWQHIEAEDAQFLDWLLPESGVSFLSLQGISGIRQLPPSIGRLSNLAILDLQACYNLEELPVEITNLRCLIHLDVSECYLLKNMPKGMGSLSELQVLKGFVIGGSGENANSSNLHDLTRLEKLRKLSINIKQDMLDSEQELDELKSLSKLDILTITWGAGGKSKSKQPESDSSTTMSASIINKDSLPEKNNVSLPENLEKLDLRCFPGSTTAKWLSPGKLKNMRRLYIRGGALRTLNCESVGIKWEIKVLRLRFLHEFVVPESDLKTQFPKSYLEIHDCPRISRQEHGDTSKGSSYPGKVSRSEIKEDETCEDE